MDADDDDSAETSSRILFIAVHLGATNARKDNCKEELAKLVCESVMKESGLLPTTEPVLDSKNQGNNPVSQSPSHNESAARLTPIRSLITTAEDAVVQAVVLMECDESLNCGLGSNLNMRGKVECDASLMSSKDQVWTGVGAVSGCKNPIKLAKSLRDHITNLRPLGLIQPNFLVASGAKQWMRDHCPNLMVPDSHLISSKSFSKYQIVKSRFDRANKNLQSLETRCDIGSSGVKSTGTLDTVGAVAIDSDFNYACAISSGGIILKLRGRIGQAATPGAGCWAQDSMAITTTGVGEYLTATLFAKKFHEKLQTLRLLHDLGRSQIQTTSEESACQAHSLLIREAMNQCFKDLLDSPALGHVPLSERLAGMLTISTFETNLTFRHQDGPEHEKELVDGNFNLYLCYGHNTKALCIGYMRANDTKAVSFVSRYNDDNDEEKKGNCSTSPPAEISVRTIDLNCICKRQPNKF